MSSEPLKNMTDFPGVSILLLDFKEGVVISILKQTDHLCKRINS